MFYFSVLYLLEMVWQITFGCLGKVPIFEKLDILLLWDGLADGIGSKKQFELAYKLICFARLRFLFGMSLISSIDSNSKFIVNDRNHGRKHRLMLQYTPYFESYSVNFIMFLYCHSLPPLFHNDHIIRVCSLDILFIADYDVPEQFADGWKVWYSRSI